MIAQLKSYDQPGFWEKGVKMLAEGARITRARGSVES
jgi:hypothetical protein